MATPKSHTEPNGTLTPIAPQLWGSWSRSGFATVATIALCPLSSNKATMQAAAIFTRAQTLMVASMAPMDKDFDILKPNGGRELRGPIALKLSVREMPASAGAPAHFELLGPRGELLAWGRPENAPAVITLVRLAAAAFKLPRAELLAALHEPSEKPEEGTGRPRLEVVRRG